MKNGEIKLTQQRILLFAFVIAMLMLLLSIVVPRLIGARLSVPVLPPENPLQPNITNIIPATSSQNSIIYTQTPTLDPAPTERFFSSPLIGETGVNLPIGFRVGQWYDNSCGVSQSPNLVEIYGVGITNSNTPYNFNFMNREKEIANFEVISYENFAKFLIPVVVARSEYIQVTITFQSNNGKSEWIDHIKYLDITTCIKP